MNNPNYFRNSSYLLNQDREYINLILRILRNLDEDIIRKIVDLLTVHEITEYMKNHWTDHIENYIQNEEESLGYYIEDYNDRY